jgi:hypothetical protein
MLHRHTVFLEAALLLAHNETKWPTLQPINDAKSIARSTRGATKD